ncbi:CoA-binding protein [Capsulimonas corticalis]|uniref:CoA-binding protein n=1 Tax=Capsulimonas corticalis TaxID=2219043 RepID=A0A402D6R7_9BACT|nr:CoA-binding protein [Capsulimonas corticalis]BDI31777.1 CoA-binding protein [Capsulimonas corticalis]
MNTIEEIDSILTSHTFAVAGASRNPEKYGSMVFHALKNDGKSVYPINPNAADIDGVPCYPSLSEAPADAEVAVFITPPPVTEAGVAEALARGIGKIWMQPGAESPKAIALCEEANATAVAGGPCILVMLKTRKH